MKKKMFKITSPNIPLFVLTLTMAGCAGVTYEPPKSGPVARVRFVSDTESITTVKSYRSKECDDEQEMMKLGNAFLLNSDFIRLGILLWNYHKDAAKEFFIRAGTPQVYMFVAMQGAQRLIMKCGVIIKQTFEEGRDYEVNYKWNNAACKVKVYEIKTNISGRAEKILLQKRDKRLTSDFSKTCLKKFEQHSRVLW